TIERERAGLCQRGRQDLRAGDESVRVGEQRATETRDLGGRWRAGDRIGRERLRVDQLGARHVCVVMWREWIAREVRTILNLRRRLRRQKVVLESERLRHAASEVAGLRVDWNAHQV